MTFADTKRVNETTIVFFPNTLSGSLGHALETENVQGWQIIRAKDALRKLGLKKYPRHGYTKTCPTQQRTSPPSNRILTQTKSGIKSTNCITTNKRTNTECNKTKYSKRGPVYDIC